MLPDASLKGTVWLDRALSRHFVIVHDSDEECVCFYLGLPRWRCLFLDTDKAGELDFVYDYELKHARYEKVG